MCPVLCSPVGYWNLLQDGAAGPEVNPNPGQMDIHSRTTPSNAFQRETVTSSGLFLGHSGYTPNKCWIYMTSYVIINPEHPCVAEGSSRLCCLSSFPSRYTQSHSALQVQVLLPVSPPTLARGFVKLHTPVCSALSGFPASLYGAFKRQYLCSKGHGFKNIQGFPCLSMTCDGETSHCCE